MNESVKQIATRLRAALLEIELDARKLGDHAELGRGQPEQFPGQHGEMIAQSKLALRHVEDARMRLGKVLQYGRDGVSIYDRQPEPDAR